MIEVIASRPAPRTYVDLTYVLLVQKNAELVKRNEKARKYSAKCTKRKNGRR